MVIQAARYRARGEGVALAHCMQLKRSSRSCVALNAGTGSDDEGFVRWRRVGVVTFRTARCRPRLSVVEGQPPR